MLIGMDLEGVDVLAGEVRYRSDELRLRYRSILGVFEHADHPAPGSIDGLIRVADLLVADAADLHRRASLFRDAEQLTLSRLSLSMMLRSWAGPPVDPSEPDVQISTIAELHAQIDRLSESGTANPEQLTELRIMLALVTASETALRRRDLQEELGRLVPGIPTPEWYHRRVDELEVAIIELLVVELEQEKLLLGLQSGFRCTVDWEHAGRYEEIEIQLAYLEWELARQSTEPLGRIGDIIESIGEADLYEQMTFVEMVAGDLEAHPDGLPIALMLLAGMDEPHQMAVMARVAENGHLDGLFDAVDEFEASMEPPRSSFGPIGDFVDGAWDSLWGAVTGVWGLTLQGTYDWDGWKTNWSGVGESLELLVESPGDFLFQVADIPTLKDNPVRWAGGLVPDVAGAILTGGTVTAASRSGRLGATMARIATKLDNLTLRLGAHLDNLITNPALRRMIDSTRLRLPVGITAGQLDEMNVLIREATEHIDGEVLIHGSRGSGVARLESDIDIAILVDDAEFSRLMDEAFDTPNAGSARERTMDHAETVGKIDSGEAGLRAVHRRLNELLGYPVDISIIRRGGPFDQGPYLPIGGGTR